MTKSKVMVDLADESEVRPPVVIEEVHELSRDEILEKIEKLEIYIARAKKRIKVHEDQLKKLREKYEKEKELLAKELAKIEGRILEVEV
jgi:hypothetical protein